MGRYGSQVTVEPAARASQPAASTGPIWSLAGGRELSFAEGPLAVGIVNVTSDSFFSGARSGTPSAAITDGERLVAEGFDLLDVGALAARAGPPADPAHEAARLVPAVEALAARTGVPVCADTFSASVARRAAAAGAAAINDISGARDPELLEACAEAGVGLVIMHIEGPPRVARAPRRYDDVIDRLLEHFAERIAAAARAGVAEERIAIDPGLDFDLSVDDDLEVLARLGELHALGRPIFLALSRKDFLGAVLAGSWERRAAAGDREWATCAATALAAAAGAQLLRLHDRTAADAMRVAARIAGPWSRA